MKLYTKIFIFVFLLDSGISFCDVALNFLEIHSLDFIRLWVANIALLLSLIMYFFISINQQLPKKILLPLTLFCFWCALLALPLPLYFKMPTVDIIVSSLQLFLALCAVYWEFKINNGAWQAIDYKFNFKYSSIFVLTNLVLLPFILSFYIIGGLSFGADYGTAGFMRLSFKGLYLQERVYKKGDKNIRLVAMIHIGKKEYYQDLSKTLIAKNAIILAEGVSDRNKLLKNTKEMTKLAEFVGLSSQHEMYLEANVIDETVLENNDLKSGEKPADIIQADVDTKDLNAETILFLKKMGEYMAQSESLIEWVMTFHQWTTTLPVETMEIINNDILDNRNQVLLGYLDKSLKQYNTIVIPWGAMHMPAFEKAVLERGFSFVNSKERLSIEWAELDL